MAPFDPSLKTELLTDASRLHGIGYALLQRDRFGKPRLIQCGSRSLSNAQKNYATIELECSAVMWAIQKCDFYLRGLRGFKVVTDHRPLLGIFEKPLSALANDRLQRIRESLVMYTFTMEWSAGKFHHIADALSRAPFFPSDSSLDVDVCAAIDTTDPALFVITRNIDHEYCKLRECIQTGTLTPDLNAFSSIFSSLRIEDNIIVQGSRLIVPRPARSTLIARLHTSHSGISKTCALARQLYSWPGMANEIKIAIAGCSACVELLPSQTTEPIQQEVASYQMEKVSTDLFEIDGHHFLLLVDRFSGYPFVARLKSLTTTAICTVLLGWFHEFGFPKWLKSDNGPQFRAQFEEFCEKYYIRHDTSSPYNARSNGLAEAAVKSMKYLLKKVNLKDGDFRVALAAWRSTPRADGFSPAFGFFGRHLRGNLPDLRSPSPVSNEFVAARQSARDSTSTKAGGVDLLPLSPGDHVMYQSPIDKNWSLGGRILKRLPYGRSYIVETYAGQFRRNRRYLRLSGKPEPRKMTSDQNTTASDTLQRRRRRSPRLRKVRFDPKPVHIS